jgi:ketosteroid isomerase-like protein
MSTPAIEKVEALKSVALKFVEAVNNGDSKTLVSLQTKDFTLIDAEGEVSQGRDGWEDYFAAYPKYRIHIQHVLTGGTGVAIIGKTTGSQVPPELEAKETVLWTAEIRGNRLAQWRLYTDIRTYGPTVDTDSPQSEA